MKILKRLVTIFPDAKNLSVTRVSLTPLASLYIIALGVLPNAYAERGPINCALPHTDTRISECTIVKSASEYPGCLNASDISQHTCIVMDTDLTFCANQPSVAITAIFDRNERTLDCNNGIIDHGWGRTSLPNGTATTQETRIPAVRFYDDRSLNDITVRNCTIRGTNHIGIQATRFFGGEFGPDGALDEGEALPVGHSNIIFEDLIIEDTGLGIYLGTYSENVEINRVHVDNSQRIAIYSEAGSHGVRIRDSIITNNNTREAIAIDSTYDSEVSNTLFVNNREGGINLYQNCGELKGGVCPVLRSTPSNNNRIINNTFVNTGVSGVHVASRQGRNHSLGWCATLDGQPGQFTDTAKDNVVSNNTFVCTEGTSLIVKNGPNTVNDNRVIAREECVPFEISTGGLGPTASSLLDGIVFNRNSIDSARPPRLRNLSQNVTIND
ncbi:right-handed parallel beta-helix repeat-containing protein [Granulosicoccus sp.]|nr:right-handed parallel beta-helix repeat-containing protein [Granulosicoccus sp.]MDB4224583.1 right-handed parallel beta-helix repeat-containing protein [Granulosicoccus sp.]